MLNTISKILCIDLVFLNLSLLCACNGSSPAQLTASPNKLQESNSQSSNTSSSQDPTNGWMEGATARAWQAFTQGGRYKWAGENDFRFPEWVKERYGPDIERAAKTPIQAGHIKGSYKSDEVALIVVDTTRQDWNRYSVVIFSERKNNPADCEIRWLFRDQDLSKVQLGWSSGDTLGIAEYRDDGSYRHCFVKRNAKKKTYICDLKQVL